MSIATDQPAAPMSLRDHIAAEEPAPAPAAAAAVVATPAVVVDEPLDPDVAQEIDALDAPTAEETPAEKRARTLKHRASAEKAIKTRLANARDREKARADQAERELTELRRSTPAPAAAPAATPQAARPAPAAADGSDPRDPEPTLDTFSDAPDPFVAWTREHGKWAARAEVRHAQHAGRQASLKAQADAQRVEQLTAFDTHAAALRKTEPGFDAAIATLDLTGPMCAVIFGSGELGPSLALALAKDPALHQRLVALPPQGQFLELGALTATVKAARANAAAAPPPITQAPAPPSQTVGGSAPAATVDTTKLGTSLRDHVAVEEAEIAERRRRGHRY